MIFSLLLVLLVGVSPGGGATLSDTYGNIAYDNGTMVWGNVPAGTAYKTSNSYDEAGLGMLFAFARSFINTIQPNPFPFGKYITRPP